jgi:hypothetical protein
VSRNRPHAGEDVYVTGTFDNWSKSEKMEKVGDAFEKSVDLPDTSEKIYYKVGTRLSQLPASIRFFPPPSFQSMRLSCDPTPRLEVIS